MANVIAVDDADVVGVIIVIIIEDQVALFDRDPFITRCWLMAALPPAKNLLPTSLPLRKTDQHTDNDLRVSRA